MCLCLWTARRHLGQVWRKACRGDERVDDSGEIFSYRTAVLGLVLGLAFLGIWLEMSGLPRWVAVCFLFVAFVLFIGLTRFVAEAGLATIRTPSDPQAFVNSAVGTSVIGQEGLVALSLTYTWIFKVRIFAMAACANARRIITLRSSTPARSLDALSDAVVRSRSSLFFSSSWRSFWTR